MLLHTHHHGGKVVATIQTFGPDKDISDPFYTLSLDVPTRGGGNDEIRIFFRDAEAMHRAIRQLHTLSTRMTSEASRELKIGGESVPF
jgi:hypothetical protein